MSGARSIPSVAANRPCQSGVSHPDHVPPILHEVRHALARLHGTGEPTRIDLLAMPLGPAGLDELTTVLGAGEVEATVTALGPTRIRETAIPGVWLVDYLSAETQRLALHLEIATVPELLCRRPEDLGDGLAMLDARLNEHGRFTEAGRNAG